MGERSKIELNPNFKEILHGNHVPVALISIYLGLIRRDEHPLVQLLPTNSIPISGLYFEERIFNEEISC